MGISDETENERKCAWFTPHHIVLIAMWLITTVSLLFMLNKGVRNNFQFYPERNMLHAGYTVVLLWYLTRTGPIIKQLPEVSPSSLPKWRFGKQIPVVIMALLLVSEIYGQGIVLPLLMLATLVVLIAWWREIDLSQVLIGFVLTIVAFLGGLPMWQNHLVERTAFFGLLIFTTPMFVAGGLLYKRTGLGGSQLYFKQYRKVAWSFLWGCLLFVPYGLLNAAGGSPGPWITWVTNWWQPFTLTFFSPITEEAWFRLFMVSLCYFALRPAFNKAPALAIVFSTLFSAIVFGLGHSGDLMHRFLNIGLLYGFPMAILYVRRDWEHAVGAHYMIDFIPWVMVFLESV